MADWSWRYNCIIQLHTCVWSRAFNSKPAHSRDQTVLSLSRFSLTYWEGTPVSHHVVANYTNHNMCSWYPTMQSFKLWTGSEKEAKQLCLVSTCWSIMGKNCAELLPLCVHFQTIVSVLKALTGIHNMVILSLCIQFNICMHTLPAAVGFASDYSTRHSLYIYLVCIIPHANRKAWTAPPVSDCHRILHLVKKAYWFLPFKMSIQINTPF